MNEHPEIHYYTKLPKFVYSDNTFITCCGYIKAHINFEKAELYANEKMIATCRLKPHLIPSRNEVSNRRFAFRFSTENLWFKDKIEFKFRFLDAQHSIVYDNITANRVCPQLIKKATPSNRVVVCMAMYNPDVEKFKQQIDSIYKQEFKNFDLIIQDDNSDEQIISKVEQLIKKHPNTLLLRNSENLGFYDNFNTLLQKINGLYDYVLLCDQDDVWHKEKIKQQIDFLNKTQSDLTYSDLRILNADGSVKFESFWQNRSNHLNNSIALLVSNVATGSTLLFKGDHLKQILPFPQKIGKCYHDHWILLSTRKHRKVRYQDKAFVDYIQHENNVTGFNEFKREKWYKRVLSFFALLNICVKIFFAKNLSKHKDFLISYQSIYNINYQRIKFWNHHLSRQESKQVGKIFSTKSDIYYFSVFLYLSFIKSIKGIYTNRTEVAIYSSILINASISLRGARKSLWKMKKQD